MGTTVQAVKAALVRARANVASANAVGAAPAVDDLERLRGYAHLFNARNWDGLRALFGEETRLEVVSRHQRRGKSAAQYLTQYGDIAPREQLRAEAGWVDGVPALAVFRPASSSPAYFIRLAWSGGQLSLIRDFRYVAYIAGDATFTPYTPRST
jgi:RNA polymerase sigma-70 factor (ECF subfamily)